jgi:hypothetical protein
MATVQRYQIHTPGRDPAKQRATIYLLGGGSTRSALGCVHFYDDGVPIPADTQRDGTIEMHMPIAAFAGVVAMLQHDSPIDLEFENDRGHLWTAEWERVGETERLTGSA